MNKTAFTAFMAPPDLFFPEVALVRSITAIAVDYLFCEQICGDRSSTSQAAQSTGVIPHRVIRVSSFRVRLATQA
jgi:hypothetical protein